MSHRSYFEAAGTLRVTMRQLLDREALRSARFGVPRRAFLSGAMGALAATTVWQQIGRFASPAEAQAGFTPPSEDCYAALRDSASPPDMQTILEAARNQHATLPETLTNMLRALESAHAGFSVSMQVHARQTATRALRAGASDELIVLGLIHDIADILSPYNHAEIMAALVRPYVSDGGYRLVRSHMEFQLQHYGDKVLLPTDLRERYAAQPWYADAVRFSDDWDHRAFDPDYDSLPLAAFAPLLSQTFSRAPAPLGERIAHACAA